MTTKNVHHGRGMIAFTVSLAGLVTGCHNLPRVDRHPTPQPPHHSASILGGTDAPVRLTAAQEADVQVALGRTLEKQGELYKAMDAYRKAIRRDAHRADAHLRLAILHDRQGKFSESAALYQQALAARPGDPDIYSDKGYSLYLQRRWVEAEMSLRQAIVLRPDHARAHNNLGLVLAHSGRPDLALVEFRQGGCSESDAQINLAYALALERRWPEARRHFQLALVADATSEPARQGLQQLDRLMARVPATPPPAAPRDAAIATVGLSAAPHSLPPLPPESPGPVPGRPTASLSLPPLPLEAPGPVPGPPAASFSLPPLPLELSGPVPRRPAAPHSLPPLPLEASGPVPSRSELPDQRVSDLYETSFTVEKPARTARDSPRVESTSGSPSPGRGPR